MINEIARHHDLSRGILRNIKSLLSSVFKLAKQQGFFDGENPRKDVSILKGRKRGEIYTYTLEETQEIHPCVLLNHNRQDAMCLSRLKEA